MPLDSSHLIFSATGGKFSGNSLWIADNFKGDKVNIKVILRENPSLSRQFDIYIKKMPDNEKLKTMEEIMRDMKKNAQSKKKES